MSDTRDTLRYDGTINGRQVMPKQPANPNLDSSPSGTRVSLEKSEIGTQSDPQQKSDREVVEIAQSCNDCGSVGEKPSDVLSSLPEPPTPKVTINYKNLEPGCFITYSTLKTEAKSVQTNVINTYIKDVIDSAQLENATTDTPFTFTLNLASKDILEFGGIQIDKIRTTLALDELGLTFTRNSDTEIQLTGTPKKDYNGKIYFCVVIDIGGSLLLHHDKNTTKTELTSFADFSRQFVHSKSFIINAHPKSLWKDLPCRGIGENGKEYDHYGDYENKDADCSGNIVEYLPAVKGIISSKPAKCFEVIAASIRGRSHAHVGKPRDDSYYYEFDGSTGWNFVAVADGACSAKYSRKGSELATQTVVKTLRSALTPEFTKTIFTNKIIQLQRWKTEFDKTNGNLATDTENEFVVNSKLDAVFHQAVYQAFTNIHNESESYKTKHPDTKINDYHTTLLVAAFRWFPELNQGKGGWFIASYWVGDGGAAILADTVGGARKVFILGEPDGGEFAGQTRFLTMTDEITADKIRNRLRFTFCDSFEAMLLVTDGITDPFFPSEAAVVDEHRWLEFYEKKIKDGCEEEPQGCKAIFDNTIDPQKKSEALLKWLEFWSKGNHDDRTILIVKLR